MAEVWLAPPLRTNRPAFQSWSFRFRVEVTRLATSTRAPCPNSTPFGFSSQTLPLLDRLPRMFDGSLPVTRLSTLLVLLGWTKLTAFCAPIEKLPQLRMAPLELVTVSLLPLATAVAWPCTICRPVGSVAAANAGAAIETIE